MDLLPSNVSNTSRRDFHVLMFPGLAYGHLSAYAELSKRLADQGLHITFLSTPLNLIKMKPTLTNQNSPGKIDLLALPLPAVEGLPPGLECTSDAHLWPLMRQAMLLLENPFEKLLHRVSPDCIVFDLLQYWTPKIAAKLGIPTVFFLTFGATYCSYDFSPHRAKCQQKITAEDLTMPPPGYPSPDICRRPFEALFSLNLSYGYNINGMRGIDRIMACIEGCQAIAVKSCNELEGKFIEYFERVTMKPVLPVGPLLSPTKTPQQEGSSEGDCGCWQWLEKQAPGSVVYAAFGSDCVLSEQQKNEVAVGLEAAQQPFILVLGLPKLASVSSPQEFGSTRGLILSGWVPQSEILRHASIGAFLTHCGWNSVMEGMSNGLPLIAMPLQWDQGLNARLIVHEFKVGVEVERQNDGFAGREEICKAVRRIMVENEGEEIKQRAAEMGNMFKRSILNGSQEMCIQKFIDHLLGLSRTAFSH